MSKGTTNKDKPFEPGEVIDFCGEELEVVINYGSSGTVKYPNDTSGEKMKYYWEFQDEVCRRIK